MSHKTKEQLLKKSGTLQDSLSKKKRYGLTWIDVPESFETKSYNKSPILVQIKENTFPKSLNNNRLPPPIY